MHQPELEPLTLVAKAVHNQADLFETPEQDRITIVVLNLLVHLFHLVQIDRDLKTNVLHLLVHLFHLLQSPQRIDQVVQLLKPLPGDVLPIILYLIEEHFLQHL